jgi:hypothetical protein
MVVSNYEKFYMHIPLYFADDFKTFKDNTRGHTARTLCVLVKDFNRKNIKIHIPTLRYLLQNNPEQINKLRELLKEFE